MIKGHVSSIFNGSGVNDSNATKTKQQLHGYYQQYELYVNRSLEKIRDLLVSGKRADYSTD